MKQEVQMKMELGIPTMIIGMLAILFRILGIGTGHMSRSEVLANPFLWVGAVLIAVGFLRHLYENAARRRVLEEDRRDLEDEIDRRSKRDE